MTGATDILSLIDSAVHDWETSPDAVRYNAPSKPASPVAMTGVTFAEACAEIGADLESMRSRLFIGNREVPATDIQIEADWSRPRPVALGMLGMAAEVERHMAALTQDERDEFVAYWQASPWSFEQAWHNWVARRTMQSIGAVMTDWGRQFAPVVAALAKSLKEFAQAFSQKPCGAQECFCHPAPFPAARDYRRRTKRRNRRR